MSTQGNEQTRSQPGILPVSMCAGGGTGGDTTSEESQESLEFELSWTDQHKEDIKAVGLLMGGSFPGWE